MSLPSEINVTLTEFKAGLRKHANTLRKHGLLHDRTLGLIAPRTKKKQ